MYGSRQGYQVNPAPSFPRHEEQVGYAKQSQDGALVQSTPGGQMVASSSNSDPWGRQQMAQSQSQSQLPFQHQSQPQMAASQQGNQMAGQESYGQPPAFSQQIPPQKFMMVQQPPSQYQQQTQRLYQPPQQLSSMQQQSRPAVAPPTTGTEELTEEERALYQPLQSAAHYVAQSMDSDDRALSKLDDYLTVIVSTQYDIPDPDLPQPFQRTERHEFPPALFNALSSKKNQGVRAGQGLFPDIGRAWFYVGSQVYLWDWTTGKLDRCDEGASDQITAVGLVRPKRQVISDDIPWILVICSEKHVTLLGLSIVDKQIQVYALPGLKLPNPTHASMMQVAYSANGRIFFVGSDKSLYEFCYEKEGGWIWRSQCRWQNYGLGGRLNAFWPGGSHPDVAYIAVDSEKQTLYALTHSSQIQVWQMLDNGGLSNASTASNLVQRAQQCTAASTALDVTKGVTIVSISVVGAEISSVVDLVAITSTGARMYYSTGMLRTELRLVHVHLPADHMTQTLQGQVKDDTKWSIAQATSRVCSGVTVFVVNGAQDKVTIILSSQSVARALSLPQIRAYNPSAGIEETFMALPLSNNTIISAVGELPHPTTSAARVRGTVNARPGTEFVQSELVTEVTVAEKRKFLVLEGDALDIITKTRPMDALAELLDHDPQTLRHYLSKWSDRFEARPAEVCAIVIGLGALAHASASFDNGAGATQSTVAQTAAEWLRTYGFEAEKKFAQTTGQESSFYRERGLTAHLSRVLRTIWTRPVVRQLASNAPFNTTLSESELKTVQRNLEGLKAFASNYPTAFGYESESYMPANAISETMKQRKALFDQILLLIEQAIEAISFVLLLIESDLPRLLITSPQLSAELSRISYQALVTTKGGREIAKQLVTSLMQQQIGQQASIENITRTLQSRCGSFCRPEDVILYKAMECIRKARDSRGSEQRERFLDESLQLFLQSVSAISKERVRDICVEYRQMQFPIGAIRLPLACAQRTDVEGRAVDYWTSLVSENEREATDSGRGAFDRRLFYYNLVTESLEGFDEQLNRQLQNGIDANGIDAERIREVAFDVAMGADDRMFHMHLYDWMVKHGREDELLSLTTDSVEEYLHHKLKNAGENVNPDLLWKYYARRGQHRSAAQALSELATSTKLAFPLDVRVQYLSSALANAKSSTQSPRFEERATVAQITDLEERSEVANVQAEVWTAVSQDDSLNDETKVEAMSALESKLMDVQELYNNYAEPLGLLQCQLLILHVSDFRDQQVVEDIWKQLLDGAVVEGDAETTKHNLSNLVERLGKRFYPSPAAFPFDFVFNYVLREGYRMRESTAVGWVVTAFHAGKVPFNDIWTAVMGLRGGEAPFGEITGMQYIDEELSVLLKAWLKEHREATMHGEEGYFPAAEVDAFVNSWLMDHAETGEGRIASVRKALAEAQKDLRRRF